MLDDEQTSNTPQDSESQDLNISGPAASATDGPGTESSAAAEQDAPPAKKAAARKTAAKKAPAKKAAAKRTTAKKATAKAADDAETSLEAPTSEAPGSEAPGSDGAPAKKAPAKRTRKAPAKKTAPAADDAQSALPIEDGQAAAESSVADEPSADSASGAPAVLFQAPDKAAPVRRTRKKAAPALADQSSADQPSSDQTGAGDTGAVQASADQTSDAETGAETPAPRKRATRKKAAPAAATSAAAETPTEGSQDAPAGEVAADEVNAEAAPKTTTRKRKSNAKKKPDANDADDQAVESDQADGDAPDAADSEGDQAQNDRGQGKRTQGGKKKSGKAESATEDDSEEDDEADDADSENDSDSDEQGGPRRRRRRGGRRRRKGGDSGSSDNKSDDSDDDDEESGDEDGDGSSEGSGSRRRRRRRRAGDNGGSHDDDPENTVTRVRQSRTGEDQITAVAGSTRLEAKKQRRREGREAGRRRAPIVSEAEFLARRESVERVMVIRQKEDLTQIAVLEDKVLVEHYVARESQTSLIGNVYVGRVQNVLPSMEAAFVDIGKGRNAVIYAGEINWAALGHKDGQPRKIESVLSSGQSILVQVTKDPIGHKGARLTGQVSLAGRFLVYVPDGTTSGISRKLPDTERARLKSLLKEIVPDTAGVIVRTAAEGASEDELTQDVERLKARWEDIEAKASGGGSPKLLYGEPDLTLKVVRDLFTEDFSRLVIEGTDAWDTVQGYVSHVAPDLEERLERYESENGRDSFAAYRIDEQIAKGVDRKVWLPSGGSLIIDRTEAMTVVDVNTGKFTGSGGNLEETVTKNNLEAAEEIVRQLRLRDIGGIIVVDFIDMVLESNRDLVLRRLVECLGRDRTRHQVAEVTSLGLVQMTRKRIGTGLLEAFSEDCPHCQGRGLVVHDMPIEPKDNGDDRGGRAGRRGRGRKGEDNGGNQNDNSRSGPPSPKDVAAAAKTENADKSEQSGKSEQSAKSEQSGKSGQSGKAAAEDAASHDATDAGSQESTDQAGSSSETGESGRSGSGRNRGRGRGRGRGNQSNESGAGGGDQGDKQSRGDHDSDAQPSDARVADDTAKSAETQAPSEASAPKGAEAPGDVQPPAQPTTKVVTRTRRRASRPAGVTTAAPVDAITVVAPAAAPASEAPVAPVEAPKVVTRTRTRGGASRPAGAESAEAPAPQEQDAPETPEVDVHVPIKKKGSRKH